MKNSQGSIGNGSCVFIRIHTMSGCFATYQFNGFIRNKVVKCSHGITAAPHTGDDGIRQFSFFFHKLCLYFFSDDTLEISYNLRKWSRPHDRTNDIMSILNSVGPFSQCLINRIFQGLCSTGHRMNFCSQKFHPIYIQRLAFCIFLSHKHFTFHTKKSCNCGSSHTMLACTGLRNKSLFPHSFCQKCLPKCIV